VVRRGSARGVRERSAIRTEQPLDNKRRAKQRLMPEPAPVIYLDREVRDS
jgi:hypothetical protein